MTQRVLITGLGIASAAGFTEAETWDALSSGRGGPGALTLFPSERCGKLPVGQLPGDPAVHSGLQGGSRSDHLALLVARQALADAGLAPGGFDPRRAGVVLGALTGGMMFIEACLDRLIREGVADPAGLAHMACSNAADRVAEALGLWGFRTTVSNACASGAAAISAACDLIEGGGADLVLAGGVDSLNRVLLNGFHSLMLVAPDGCRPFDRERLGMTVGEGAGVLVLESEHHALARGARVRAVLAGRGNSCDAYHATSPRPDGEGLYRAMELALQTAGLTPADVGYVNAHGTGTLDNDVAEGRAICRLFGGAVPQVSSTKRFFGHTMAAAGAIEAIVCVLALEHQLVPPNLGLREVDPEVGFTPPAAPLRVPLRAAMSNSLGFGGNNSALVLRLPQEQPEPPGVAARRNGDGGAGPAEATAGAWLADVLGVGQLRPAAEPAAGPVLDPAGGEAWLAHRLALPPGSGVLDPAQLKRVGRAQAMALTAVKLAADSAGLAPADPSVAVCVGTAWAELGDEVRFLESIIRRGEVGARPAWFASSVHNALASRIAMTFAWQGENHTFTHDELSFESALWQGATLLRRGRAGRCVVCGADALTDFLELRGHLLGLYGPAAVARSPAQGAGPDRGGPVPGEGAGALVLAPPGSVEAPLARLLALEARGPRRMGWLNPDQQLRFVNGALRRAGVDPRTVGLLLLGGGDPVLDRVHRQLLRGDTPLPGPGAGVGIYRHLTGDFATASALGAALAVQAVSSGRVPAEVRLLGAPPAAPLRRVLLYNLARSGHHSVMVFSSAAG